MKKTLLALAVPAVLAAGSASAAINLYNQNGVIVDIGGSAEVQFFKDTDETKDSTLRIDDGDFLVNTTIEIAPGFSAVGGIGFFFEDDGSSSGAVKSDELYVGLASNFGTITYGRQYTLADDVGNGKDYELGVGDVSYGDVLSSRVIKWRYDNGGTFYGAASTMLDSDEDEASSGSYGYDGVVGVRYAGFDVRLFGYAGYNMINDSLSLDSFAPKDVNRQDITGFNLEADYAFGAFDFSAGFGMVNFEAVQIRNEEGELVEPIGDQGGDNDVTTYHFAAGYQADPRTYFAAGFYYLTTDNSGAYVEHKRHSFYTNVTYALHPNAKVYAEIGIADREINTEGKKEDQKVDDLGYVLGMEVTF